MLIFFIPSYSCEKITTSKFLDNEEIRLVKTIKYPNKTWNLKYDNKNRITDILCSNEIIRLSYNGDDLVKFVSTDSIGTIINSINFTKVSNKISYSGTKVGKIYIDDIGFPIKIEETIEYYGDEGFSNNFYCRTEIFTYTTKNENIIEITIGGITTEWGLEDDSYGYYGKLIREDTIPPIPNEYEYKYDNKKNPFYNCKTPKWFLIYFLSDDSWGIFGSKNNLSKIIRGKDTWDVPQNTIYRYDRYRYPLKGKIKSHFDKEIIEFIYTVNDTLTINNEKMIINKPI